METKFVLSYVLSATVLTVVIAEPIPNRMVNDFGSFIERQDNENFCPFPPVLVLDKEKTKLCLETESERTGSLVQICDGIVQISNDVCHKLNGSISTPSLGQYNVEKLCDELEKRTIFRNNDTCMDVCAEGKANYICRLNVELYKTLYAYFRGLSKFPVVHHVIHQLPRYFPFPPHGSMEKGMVLGACQTDRPPNVTNKLCSAIKELAATNGEQNSTALMSIEDWLKNVTADWNPCPAIKGPLNITNSDCESTFCKDNSTIQICRSIALGLIPLKSSGNSARTTTAPTQNPNTESNQENTSQVLIPTKINPAASTSIKPKPDNSVTKQVADGDNSNPTLPSVTATVTKTTTPNLNRDLTPDASTTIKTSTNGTQQPENPSPNTTDNPNGKGDASLSTTTVTDGPEEIVTPSGIEGTSKEGVNKPIVTDQPIPTTSTEQKKDDEASKKKGEIYTEDEDVVPGGISFMSYFLVFLVLCVAGYILFHNKQKIIALVIEGKSASSGRRPSSKEYKRLKTDDVMPSLEKSANTSNYVY